MFGFPRLDVSLDALLFMICCSVWKGLGKKTHCNQCGQLSRCARENWLLTDGKDAPQRWTKHFSISESMKWKTDNTLTQKAAMTNANGV